MAGSIRHTSRTTVAPPPTPDTRRDDLNGTRSRAMHHQEHMQALCSHAAFVLNWNAVEGAACCNGSSGSSSV